jgi:pilus assembly protein CpaB
MLRIALIFVALVAAAGAAWLAYGNLRAPRPQVVETAPPEPTVEILVAEADIGFGATVGENALGWRAWPEKFAHPDFIRREARPEAPTELVGALTRTRIVAGEPVKPGQLAEDGGGVLAAMLGAGERAVAVRISAENTAGGFVLPGDRVDVLLTRVVTLPDGRETGMAETLLRNVEVLAIDQTAGSTETDAVIGETATLRLTAAQAELIVGAEADGRLSLALRAVTDRDAAPPEAAAPEPTAVAFAPEPAAPTAPAEKIVRVRRAGLPENVSLP